MSAVFLAALRGGRAAAPVAPSANDNVPAPSITEAAKALAEKGFAVFEVHGVANGLCTCDRAECPSAGKHPRTANGFKDAIKDPIKIDFRPDSNIGIATGDMSGCFVVDIDPRNGGDQTWQKLIEIHGPIPTTLEVASGGGGSHFYLRMPKAPHAALNSKLGQGIDLKADRGYVVGPPSMHASGRAYQFVPGRGPGEVPIADAPGWLLALATKAAPAKATPTTAQPTATAPPPNLEEIAAAAEALTKIGPAIEGQGGDALTFKAAALVRDHIADEESALILMGSWNLGTDGFPGCQPPWSAEELRSKVRNAFAYGQGAAGERSSDRRAVDRVVANMAAAALAAKPRLDPSTLAGRLEQARLDLAAYRADGAKAGEEVFCEPLTDLMKRPRVRTAWLIEGLLPERAVAILAGPPKATKSWCLIDFALAIATGGTALAHFPCATPRTCLLLQAEDSARSIQNRVRALVKGRGLSSVPAKIFLRIEKSPLDLSQDEALIRIIAAARALPELPSLIGIDTLRDHSGAADENSSGEMSIVMGNLRALRNILGSSLVVVHHVGKANADSPRSPGDRLRGSSAIFGAIDGLISLEPGQTEVMDSGISTFPSDVDVVLRGLRSAAPFDLRLEVQDDSGGEAERAAFIYSAQNEATRALAAAKANAEAETTLLKALRQEYERNGHQALSINGLHTLTGLRKNVVSQSLRSLNTRGDVISVGAGEHPKWAPVKHDAPAKV